MEISCVVCAPVMAINAPLQDDKSNEVSNDSNGGFIVYLTCEGDIIVIKRRKETKACHHSNFDSYTPL